MRRRISLGREAPETGIETEVETAGIGTTAAGRDRGGPTSFLMHLRRPCDLQPLHGAHRARWICGRGS